MRALNCKRAIPMIPLYVAGDLENASERAVAGHLEGCESCRQLADDFAESSSLLSQACAPPPFDADFYSGIREAVLTEIAREQRPARPSFFRWPWAYASAVAAIVIVVGVLLLVHFGRTSAEAPAGLAVAPPPPSDSRPVNPEEAKSPTPQSPEPQQGAAPVGLETPRRRSRNYPLRDGSANRSQPVPQSDAVAATEPSVDQTKAIAAAMTKVTPTLPGSATSVVGSASSPLGRASVSQVPRIEIQTADPNIRIIWLAPEAPANSEELNHDQDQYENGKLK